MRKYIPSSAYDELGVGGKRGVGRLSGCPFHATRVKDK